MRVLTKNSVMLLFFVSTDVLAYSLFDPKPSSEIRELSTDRPDTTESPYTVDVGHYQMEWEIVSYGTDKSGDERTRTLTSSINLKAGVSENIDLQLILEPSTYVETHTSAGTETASGMSDTEIRAKFNVWGNDAGDTAFAIMPFVRLPTHDGEFGDNGKTEGGLILPLAVKLPGEWDSAAMLEFDAVRNSDNDGYVLELVKSITFGHSIRGKLSGFFEFVNINRNESGAEGEAYFNGGLMYAMSNSLQLDTGFNLGITEAAEDRRYFVGFSWRY